MTEQAPRGDDPTPPARPSLAATAALTYGTNLAAASLSLVNVLILARALGPVGRGDIAFLITVATISSHLSALGVQEANANIGGSEGRLRSRLATNSFLLALALGAVGAGVVAGLVSVFPAVGGEARRILLWLALAAIPLVILKTYLNFLVQADYAFKVTNVVWLLGPVTTVTVNGLLAALGLITVDAALAAWVAGQALGAAVLVAYVARHAGFGRPDPALARRTLGFGLKTHIGRLMGVGNYRADQWILGSMAGSRELGLYSVAVAWAELLFYLPGVLVMVQRPHLVRATREEAAAFAARVFRVAAVLAAFAATALVVLAPLLCVMVFGEEFRGSIDDLRVLAFGAFGIVAVELLASALTAQRAAIAGTIGIAVAFLVTIALDLLLIPEHGGRGAAIATTVAYTVGGAVVAVIFTRVLGGSLIDLAPRGTEVPWFLRRLRSRFSGQAAS